MKASLQNSFLQEGIHSRDFQGGLGGNSDSLRLPGMKKTPVDIMKSPDKESRLL